jgi:ribonuclease Y
LHRSKEVAIIAGSPAAEPGANREPRIIVNNEAVTDEQSKELAKEIAKRIEHDSRYPGRIKVTIIRETRIVEYAR